MIANLFAYFYYQSIAPLWSPFLAWFKPWLVECTGLFEVAPLLDFSLKPLNFDFILSSSIFFFSWEITSTK